MIDKFLYQILTVHLIIAMPLIPRRQLMATCMIIGALSCFVCAYLFQTEYMGTNYEAIGRWVSFVGKFTLSSSFGWAKLSVFNEYK